MLEKIARNGNSLGETQADGNSAQFGQVDGHHEKTKQKKSMWIPIEDGIVQIAGPPNITYKATAGSIGDKKFRENFSERRWGSAREALARAREYYKTVKSKVNRDRSLMSNINHRSASQLTIALERLEPTGMTLLDAVDLAIKVWNKNRVRTRVSVDHAIKEFLRWKERENKAPRYLRALRIELEAFQAAFDDKLISDINYAMIEEFLDARNISEVTWNNWRRDLRTFFNFCVSERNRWITSNPAESVAYKKVVLDPVDVLKIDEVKELLKAAYNHETPNHRGTMDKGRQVPWLVLGLFGGLRREEADAAQWEDVDWESGTFQVHSVKVRSAQNRYIHMEPVLVNWLKLCKPENATGPMGTGVHARRNDFQKLTELTELPLNENRYRHSFGSHHVWHFKDKQKAMLEMGHTVVRTFDTYYNRPIPPSIAKQYWQLHPEEVL
jgi:integrase